MEENSNYIIFKIKYLSKIILINSMKKVIIQWQDQFGNWQHYTTMHHQPSAFRTAQNRASNQNRRYRLIDDFGNLIDVINP